MIQAGHIVTLMVAASSSMHDYMLVSESVQEEASVVLWYVVVTTWAVIIGRLMPFFGWSARSCGARSITMNSRSEDGHLKMMRQSKSA